MHTLKLDQGMKRIAIDMDEVLADTLTKHLSAYNQEYGDILTKADLAGRHVHEVVREDRKERVRNYPRNRDFFCDIPVMPGSQEVVARLVERHQIFVTTAAMEYPTSFTAKHDWLRKHFPFIPDSNIVFCGDKSIIAADFLIDDNAHHFRLFRGIGLLFSAPHNLNETRYHRFENWSDVESYFR
jgi:5'(3')-deoxyribonucleotidase